MKTLLKIILIILAGASQAGAAQEVFLMLNYAKNAELHRIKTNDEFYSPIGFFLETEPAKAFYIDKIKNFRFYQIKPAEKKTINLDLSAHNSSHRLTRRHFIPEWLINIDQNLLQISPLRVELLTYYCVESFWRGQRPGKALERTIGSFIDIMVPANCNGSAGLLHGNCGVFHFPGQDYTQGDIYYYAWWGRQGGKISKNLVDHDIKIAFESNEPDARFFGVEKTSDGLELAYIVGSDILRKWLAEHEMHKQAETALCSLATLTNDEPGKGIHISVYSAQDNVIYRFVARNGRVEAPRILDLDEPIDALLVDSHGNLYFSKRAAKPVKTGISSFSKENIESVRYDESFTSAGFEEDFTCSEEEIPPAKSFEKISGNIVLSQQFYQQVYLVMEDSDTPVHFSNVNLNKKYFSVDFVFHNFSDSDFYNDWAHLLRQAEIPGNKLSPLSSDVEEFPDQYKEPESVILAIY